MTWEQFSEFFALLALQLRAADADEAMARAYYLALKDLEPEFVGLAAERFGRTHVNADGEAWFPKAPEWRAMARRIERARSETMRRVLWKLPEPLCAACDDTGWRRGDAGVIPCECQRQRRLEILGRRPMPALPPVGEVPENQDAMARVRAMMAPAIKSVPRPRFMVVTPDFEQAAEDDPVLAAELARRRRTS